MKILIIEVNWLGDVLFSTPAIKALRRKFPDSSISCLVVPRVREILEGNPHINELIINDEVGLHQCPLGRFKLAKELREKKFALAVLFHRSFSRAAVAYLAGIPKRIGYGTLKRWFLLSENIPMPKKDSLHRIDYYLNIVKRLGCDTEDRNYEFFVSREDETFVDNFLAGEGIVPGDFVVCLNAGGNWGPKRWPKENFAKTADRLISEHKAKIIFSGSKDDTGLILDITKLMLNKPIIAAGRLILKHAACLFRRSSLVISGDSGPLHIAASMEVDVIGLFGPTSPRVTGPIGRGRIKVIQKDIGCKVPCYDVSCNDNRCMQAITVEDVLIEVEKMLKSNTC